MADGVLGEAEETSMLSFRRFQGRASLVSCLVILEAAVVLSKSFNKALQRRERVRGATSAAAGHVAQ